MPFWLQYPLDGKARALKLVSPRPSPPAKRIRPNAQPNPAVRGLPRPKHRQIRPHDTASMTTPPQPHAGYHGVPDGQSTMAVPSERIPAKPSHSQQPHVGSRNSNAQIPGSGHTSARPAVSAPPHHMQSKPSSASASDRDSPPATTKSHGTVYSQLIRYASNLSDECRKYNTVEEVDDGSRAFLLRRKVSMQLEKLPGSSKVLDNILDIANLDPGFQKAKEIDLDGLSHATITRMWECLARNTVGNGDTGAMESNNSKTGPGCSQTSGIKRGPRGMFAGCVGEKYDGLSWVVVSAPRTWCFMARLQMTSCMFQCVQYEEVLNTGLQMSKNGMN